MTARGIVLGLLLTIASISSATSLRFQSPLSHDGTLRLDTTDTLDLSEFTLSLTTAYERHPVTIRFDDNSFEPLIANRIVTELTGVIGIFRFLDFGFRLPFIAQPGVLPTYELPSLESFSLGDTDLVLRIPILDPGYFDFGFTLVGQLSLPTGRPTQLSGRGGVGGGIKLVFDGALGDSGLYLIAQAGAELGPEQTIAGDTIGQRLNAGLGLLYGIEAGPVDIDISADLLANLGLASPGSGSDDLIEIGLGARFFLTSWLSAHLGAQLPLSPAIGSPSVRVLAGLSFRYAAQDQDGDGFIDRVDACPLENEDFDFDRDLDGCPDSGEPEPAEIEAQDNDFDGDGLPDEIDDCPYSAEDVDGNQDTDGCPDQDDDQDGVYDYNDLCPNEKEVPNGIDDFDGCPDEGDPLVVREGNRLDIRERVMFEVGSSTIVDISKRVLDSVAIKVNASPDVELLSIEGHTDSAGPAAANLALSQSRAQAVKDYLIRQGVARHRLRARGFGEERPIAPNSSEEGRQINRRVEFLVNP